MMISLLKRFPVMGAALAIALLGVASAAADTGACGRDAWSPAASGITTNVTGYGTANLGNVFTSNVTGTVCALGIYDGNNATYTTPEIVGLYDSQGNLMTYTTVTISDTLYDNYYWASTAPVTVYAGDTYTVVDFNSGNGWGYGPAPIDHWATFTGQTMDFNGSLDFPTDGSDFPTTFYGGDVMLSPEPGSLLLFGSGLIGLAGAVRRKLRRS